MNDMDFIIDEDFSKLCIETDSDGYVLNFATGGGSVNGSTTFTTMPEDEDKFFSYFMAYKYNGETLEFDEEKYNEIYVNVEPIPSTEEKVTELQEQLATANETIDMLTECLLEVSEIIYS